MKQKADEVSKRRMRTCPEHCCQVSLYPVKSGLFLKINYGRKSLLACFQLQLHRIQLFFIQFAPKFWQHWSCTLVDCADCGSNSFASCAVAAMATATAPPPLAACCCCGWFLCCWCCCPGVGVGVGVPLSDSTSAAAAQLQQITGSNKNNKRTSASLQNACSLYCFPIFLFSLFVFFCFLI